MKICEKLTIYRNKIQNLETGRSHIHHLDMGTSISDILLTLGFDQVEEAQNYQEAVD